jgi:hypothetical protein
MKKLVKILVFSFTVLLTILTIYAAYQVVHLKLWVKSSPENVPELTAAQKEEDFKYLTDLVKDVYPFAQLLHEKKGLDNINSLKDMYIRRARESKDNKEFLSLFVEYTNRLGQAGHGGLVFPQKFNFYESYTLGIPKDAYNKTQYWRNKASELELYVHADIDVIYKDGEYILSADFITGTTEIPAGSVIKRVNGIPVDDYAKSLQDKVTLRYDDNKNKVYSSMLFCGNTDSDVDGWEVDFKLPEGGILKAKIKKIPGYKYPYGSKMYSGGNILCSKLTDEIGYVKINTFSGEFINSDNEILQDYMKNSGGRFKKLIIDLRGNPGGELTYWKDNLIRPLLKEAKEYSQVTALRRGFFKRMNIRHKMYRLIYSNHLLDEKTHYVSSVREIESVDMNSKEWKSYEITKRIEPGNSFPFDGQVYILVDNDSVSSADGIVIAVRELKLGKVVGVNSFGWGNIYISPITNALPNSGLMFRMDVELTINSDKRETSIYGTRPDVNLAPSTYPTPFPKSFLIEDLLRDEWVKWCMEN